MNRLVAFFISLLLLSLPAVAQEPEATVDSLESALPAATSDVPVEQLLRELTQVSLSELTELVRALETAGGRELLPLFEVMLAGDLYYDEDSLQLVRVQKSGTVERGFDVLSGESLGERKISSLEKVRINNRLRGQLRTTIARINLTQGSAEQRESAVRAMLGNIDEVSVELLRQARVEEEEASVQELLDVGVALFDLRNGLDDGTVLAAVSILEGRLEAPVRNALTSLANNSQELSPAIQEAVADALESIQSRIKFYQFLEQMFFGLSLGSVLLLAAIGLAVTFGVMGVINMAHGEMLMLGAYSTYVVQQLMPNAINASIIVALPVAFLVSAGVGILIQRFVIRYLNGRPLETLLATFGISLILQQTVRTIFSPLNRRVVAPEWLSGSWQFNEVLSLTYNRLYILAFSLCVFAVLLFILKKTSLGLSVRAVSQNRAMARAMGIRTDWVDALTFGLGSGIAGIAGVALCQLTNVGPNLGQSYIIDSFMVVVFGGVGNLFGTLLAAFSLGVGNKFLEPITGAVMANILILVFIILFIQKRPKGLFPQKGRAAD